MSANLKKLRPYDQAPRPRRSLVPGAPDSAATLWLVVAALWLAASTGIGALWIVQQIAPQLSLNLHFAGPLHINIRVVFEASRSLAAFQNAVVFGWLTNAAIGAIWFIAPRLSGRPLVSNAGANTALGLWNLAVLLGVASIYLGILPANGVLSVFPLPVDALAVLALLMVNGIFWGSVARGIGPTTYVSIGYFGIGLLAFLGLYALDAAAPLLNLAAPWPALIDGFFARALETYWLLGAAVGTLYYVIPRATGNPLYSTGLALLGLLAWLVLSVLSGLGTLLDPSIPYALTTLGNVATMLLVLPAFLVVANLLLSMRGRWSLMLGTGTIAFALIALAFLLASSILQGVGALRTVQAHVIGTEWPLGDFIYASLGAYGFAALALTDHAFPRLLRRVWGDSPLGTAVLWASFIGTAVAGIALMFGGLAQGSLFTQGATPDVINGTLVWFRLGALGGLGLTALGGLGMLGNLFLMYTDGRLADYAVTDPPAPSSTALSSTASASPAGS